MGKSNFFCAYDLKKNIESFDFPKINAFIGVLFYILTFYGYE